MVRSRTGLGSPQSSAIRYCWYNCKPAEGKTGTQAEASMNTLANREVLLIWQEKQEEIGLLYRWKLKIFILPYNSCLADRDTSAAPKHKDTTLCIHQNSSCGEAGLATACMRPKSQI